MAALWPPPMPSRLHGKYRNMKAHASEAWYQDPAIWVATGFVLFMGIFVRYVLPKILAGLDARSVAIADQLAQATKLREEAQMVLQDFKEKQEEMEVEASRILEEARRDAELLRTKAKDELAAMMTRRQAQAEEKIMIMEKQAESDIRMKMIELATNAAAAMLRENNTGADVVTTRAIAQLEQKIH